MIVREFREAWRRLTRRPGYALLSVVVLGVGLGITLFLFSVVDTMVLQPLPFPHADRLMAVGDVPDNGNGIGNIDSDQYLLLRGHLRSVDALGAYTEVGVNLDQGRGATYRNGTRFTASMMDMLGVKPILGRAFTAADDVQGAAPVVLLGETLWRHDFRADPNIVGRSVRIDGSWATVVGVLPAGFGFPQDSELWMPLQLGIGQHRSLSGVARLAPGVSLAQARAELATKADELRRALPVEQRVRASTIKPLALSFTPEDTRGWLWLMLGAGGLVLLLACVNVANLQLVQTLQRRHELALRSALGGSRARLMAGALAESLLLSVASLALAWPITRGAVRWLQVSFAATDNPLPSTYRFDADGWMLLFAFGVALLSTAVVGLIPAWRAARADLQDALRDGSKGSSGGFGKATRAMVVAQVALTVVLLVGAGMFVRVLVGLMTQSPVGAAHAVNVLTAQFAMPRAEYPHDAQRIRFLETLVERLRSEPGVVDATASNTIPSAMLGSREDVALPGQGQPPDGWPQAEMGIVDVHFLDTYGVRLREGRFFDARDRAGSQRVAVIDAKMAAALWPGDDPLNRKLILHPGKPQAETVTVVGVIESLQLASALSKSQPGLLLPLPQAAGASSMGRVGVSVRTHVDAATWTRHLIETAHAVDPQVAVFEVYSQAAAMAMSRTNLVVLTDIFSALGLVALLLAGAGLYGMLAFSVAQRTRELGIRRAIGAGHGAIVRTVVRQLAWQLGLGLGIGLLLAIPWSSMLAEPGLHTRAHDPEVFVPVLLLVLGVSVIAALVPLVRALRVDPAVALRYE